MKINVFLIVALTFSLTSFGQNVPPYLINDLKIAAPVFLFEDPFNGNKSVTSLQEYLGELVQVPYGVSPDGAIGTLVLGFTVNPKGNLRDIVVKNSLSEEVDNAVIRILESTSGAWLPGLMNGIPTQMQREVSLVFKPSPGYDLQGAAKKMQDRGNQMLFTKEKPGKALKYYNQAVKLLPHNESILAARSLCKYRLGDHRGALEDYARFLAVENPYLEYNDIELTQKVLDSLTALAMTDQ